MIGAVFAVEPDPAKAAVLIRQHIEKKRKALGVPSVELGTITVTPSQPAD